MTRDQLVEKIMQTKREMKTAGPIHRKDLRKHIRRMTAQLAQYDRFYAEAKRGVA